MAEATVPKNNKQQQQWRWMKERRWVPSGRLEEVFGASVLEAYAMSEASHLMASNPLPEDGPYKAGSFGKPVDQEMAILVDTGQILVAEIWERLLNADENGNVQVRDKATQEFGNSNGSRTAERSGKRHQDSEKSEVDCERSSIFKRKKIKNDGYKDVGSKGKDDTWNNIKKDWESSKESWKRRQPSNIGKDSKNKQGILVPIGVKNKVYPWFWGTPRMKKKEEEDAVGGEKFKTVYLPPLKEPPDKENYVQGK